MVNDEMFREDLLYRINTIQIELPPLRERKEDIPMLVDFFKKKYETKYNKPTFTIEPSGIEKLMKYQWPGNIRELQHIVEKAVIMSENDVLDENDFWFSSLPKHPLRIHDTLDLAENEKRIIMQAIEKSRGNYSKAAKELGVSRKTLYNKLKKYEIE